MENSDKPTYAIIVLYKTGKAELLRDNERKIFVSDNANLITEYFSMYYGINAAVKNFRLVNIKKINENPERVRDLTSVLASLDFQ